MKSKPPPQKFYRERAIADLTGIVRADLKAFRRKSLKKRTDWTAAQGREIVLTQSGLDKLVSFLRKSTNAKVASVDFTPCLLPSPEEKKEASEQLVDLTVRRLLPNRKLLIARDPRGRDVRVKVKDSANFLPKMALRARLVAPGTYQLEGRCPRFLGRY